MNKILCIIGLMLIMVVVAAAAPKNLKYRRHQKALARGLKRCTKTVNRLHADATKKKKTEWTINYADPRIKRYSVELKDGRYVCVPKKPSDQYVTKTTLISKWRLR